MSLYAHEIRAYMQQKPVFQYAYWLKMVQRYRSPWEICSGGIRLQDIRQVTLAEIHPNKYGGFHSEVVQGDTAREFTSNSLLLAIQKVESHPQIKTRVCIVKHAQKLLAQPWRIRDNSWVLREAKSGKELGRVKYNHAFDATTFSGLNKVPMGSFTTQQEAFAAIEDALHLGGVLIPWTAVEYPP